MKVAIPICPADAERAFELLTWIGQLGPCSQHDCVLILDAGVDWTHALALSELANRVFRSASVVATQLPVVGWPDGANALFLECARYLREETFLWLEPDAIPLRKGWLDILEKTVGFGFLGHIYDSNKEGLPPRVMSGIAIYPPHAIDFIEPLMRQHPTWAWDIAGAPVMVERGHHSPLIHHFWGQKDLPPTFVSVKAQDSPKNAFTLNDINKGAVIFHRNKDGSLIQELRYSLGMDSPPDDTTSLTSSSGNLVVVLPVCNVDVELMIKSLEWMNDLGMEKTHAALLSFDQTTIRYAIPKVKARAEQVFTSVATTSYKIRRGTAFPQTAAWQHAAREMMTVGKPWVWLEADNVILKKDWLLRLEAEYERAGKSFAGPFMPGRGHINGSAIYPRNTPQRVPRTMSHTNNAFDVEMATEMMNDCHNIGHLWQCAWGVVNDRLDPIGGEILPTFPKGSPLLAQISPKALVFHRDKSGTLIQRLRERRNV